MSSALASGLPDSASSRTTSTRSATPFAAAVARADAIAAADWSVATTRSARPLAREPGRDDTCAAAEVDRLGDAGSGIQVLEQEARADVDRGPREGGAVGDDGEAGGGIRLPAGPGGCRRRPAGSAAMSTRAFCRAWVTSSRPKLWRRTSFIDTAMCLTMPAANTRTPGAACCAMVSAISLRASSERGSRSSTTSAPAVSSASRA